MNMRIIEAMSDEASLSVNFFVSEQHTNLHL